MAAPGGVAPASYYPGQLLNSLAGNTQSNEARLRLLERRLTGDAVAGDQQQQGGGSSSSHHLQVGELSRMIVPGTSRQAAPGSNSQDSFCSELKTGAQAPQHGHPSGLQPGASAPRQPLGWNPGAQQQQAVQVVDQQQQLSQDGARELKRKRTSSPVEQRPLLSVASPAGNSCGTCSFAPCARCTTCMYEASGIIHPLALLHISMPTCTRTCTAPTPHCSWCMHTCTNCMCALSSYHPPCTPTASSPPINPSTHAAAPPSQPPTLQAPPLCAPCSPHSPPSPTASPPPAQPASPRPRALPAGPPPPTPPPAVKPNSTPTSRPSTPAAETRSCQEEGAPARMTGPAVAHSTHSTAPPTSLA